MATAGEEIRRMQDGIRDWVRRATRRGEGELRKVPPPVLLSLLCASAFCPLLVGVGIAGATAVAGLGVLSSVGGGVLSTVLADAVDRLRRCGKPGLSKQDLEEGVAQQIQNALAAGDEHAEELRSEIAAVFERIDAGETLLQAAIDAGNERVHGDVIAVIELLGDGFSELGFMIDDVARAAADIQKSLDEQGANVRGIIAQNYRQSTEIRLIREKVVSLEARRDPGMAKSDRVMRWENRCPYRGLLPFAQDDEEVFYGRRRLTTELAITLERQMTSGGIVVVTGASGAGKSSLLQAGLLPMLARGVQVAGSEKWSYTTITPGKDPLGELAVALAVLGNTDSAMIRDGLTRRPDQAHLAVRQAVAAEAARRGPARQLSSADPSRLVLIVDQFEQVFTLNPGLDGEPERRAFIAALCAAATNPAGPSGQPPALMVIAVRGDFWDRCAAYPELARELQDGQFVVGPMTESDLRLAITGPAEAAGLHIDPALTNAVVSDLHAAGGDDAAGVLPLLSQAMLLTWENRDGDQLTTRGYEMTGGVSRAVQTSADAVYDRLGGEQHGLAREILRSMTVAGRDGTFARRPLNRADLYAGRTDADRSRIDEVLEAFAAKRLIVLDDGNAQIAHDALLSAWPKLRGWLADDQASWILYGQLADDAAAWHGKREDPSYLYRGTQLVSLRQASARWAEDPRRYPALTGVQRDFLRASDRAEARSIRQRRAMTGVLVVLLVASLVAAGLAVKAASDANQQRKMALSGQLATQSEALDTTDPAGAAELAASAWGLAHTPLARVSLLDALAQPDRAVLVVAPSTNGVSVSVSPDGKTLATASSDGTARLWDVATHRQIGRPLAADRGKTYLVAFSPDGKTLATASSDGTARLWDVATRRQIGGPLSADDGGQISSVAFSPDGKTLATADNADMVWLWDVATHQQIGEPLAPATGSAVNAVAFSRDGKILATAGNDGTARLWDAATHRQIGGPLAAGGTDVSSVAFSPDGKTLATASREGPARLWDVATHRQIGAPLSTAHKSVTVVVFSPDGKTLATASGNTAQLWDVATHQQIGGPPNTGASDLSAVAFSPDGKTLATAGLDGTARLWNIALWGQVGAALEDPGSELVAVAFSPDGKTLATASSDGRTQLWAVATHRQIGEPLTTGGEQVSAVAFSPNGEILATAGLDGTARLWAVATHRRIGGPLITGSDIGVNAVAFSPDGKILATAANTTFQLWDVATHRRIGGPLLTGPAAEGAYSVAFSPDSRIFATGSGDGTVRLWATATRKQLGAPLSASGSAAYGGLYGSAVYGLAFSPDGNTLATASEADTVQLWDVTTHRQIGVPMTTFGGGSASAVAFSPDGNTLATAWGDGTARLWDVATHQQIGLPLTADSQQSSGVAFSPDGKILATAGFDGTARLWDVAFPRDLVAAVCGISGGNSLPLQQWDSDVQSEPYQRACP